MKDEKKVLKKGPKRNPEGTLKEEWKYAYFHINCCTTKGHEDCRSTNCFMFGKDKNERDEALKAIECDDIAFEMDTMSTDGK